MIVLTLKNSTSLLVSIQDRFGDVLNRVTITGLDAGGVHVDKELSMHLYEQLFMEPDIHDLDVEDVHEIVDDGLNDFREDGKQNFSSPTDSLKVKIGGRRMDHPKIQVTRGVMNIEPCARSIFVSNRLTKSYLVRRRINSSESSSRGLLMKWFVELRDIN